MRLVTWNVNGIRAIMKKGFEDIMATLDPDIVCLQETKAQADQIEVDESLYPYQYINSAKRKGYSGTMIMGLDEPINVMYGIQDPVHDTEGRVITAEYDKFYLVDVYVPNSGEGLKRLDYRMEWDQAFSAYLKKLSEKKPLLVCGDFNIARTAQDVYDEAAVSGFSGYTPEERSSFEAHFTPFLVDAYRALHPDKNGYSWWNYYSRGRERGQGMRIDYWLVSPELMDKVRSVTILDDIYGSDHCPVELDIDL